MKKTYFLFLLLSLFVALSSLSFENNEEGECTASSGPRKSAGPPSCYCGEPPLAMTCAIAGCHEGSTVNSGTAQLTLNLGGAETGGYIAGTTYTGTITLSRTGLVRGGFQVVALQNSDITTTPGVLSLVDNNRTLIINNAHPHSGGCATQNKTWIEHTSNGIDDVANNAISWQFTWQAPSDNVGGITFYVAGLDADKDLENTGDHVYTIAKTYTASPLGIDDISRVAPISIFPNPVADILHFNFTSSADAKPGDGITITNAVGQTVLRLAVVTDISVANFAKGIYTVHVIYNGNKFDKKFVKE